MNNSSLSPYAFREGGEKAIHDMLVECALQNCSIIMGSDAHYCSHVGKFDFVEKIMDEIDFPEELVLNYDVDRFFEYFSFLK